MIHKDTFPRLWHRSFSFSSYPCPCLSPFLSPSLCLFFRILESPFYCYVWSSLQASPAKRVPQVEIRLLGWRWVVFWRRNLEDVKKYDVVSLPNRGVPIHTSLSLLCMLLSIVLLLPRRANRVNLLC